MNINHNLTKRRLAMVKAAITAQALDCREIGVAVHASRAYMIVFMRELLKLNMVHVERWNRVYQTDAAVYRWGKGKSAPRPPAKLNKDILMAYRMRLKADKERRELHLARARAQDNASRLVKRLKREPQNPFSALFAGGHP